ncbi:MAG TPA: DUF3299 domain-containing protein [Pirellulales bacterium]|jgi:hypothetical protein|nr:DUF3299 domain-containing protein [Pirellulales bacterium]
MNHPALAILASAWLILFAVAGCEDSRAPAMTAPPTGLGQTPVGESAGVSNPSQVDTPGSTAAAVDEVPPGPAAGDPSISEPVPAARPERTRDISFDDLKFEIEKGDPFKRSLLTDKIEALESKPIRIRGYILPSFQQSGLTQFVLVRDNQSCCFGPGAALYDCVIVEMKPGKSTDYSLYPVAVDGTFSIREMADPDGKTVAVYHLDGQSVR